MPSLLRFALILTILSAFGSSSAIAADPLEGTWLFKARTETGEKRNDKLPPVQWIFLKGKLTGRLGDKSEDMGTYKVDGDAKPATIDLKMGLKPEKPGIFAIDGDKLRICLPDARGERRPKSFEESEIRIETWEFERVKKAAGQ